MSDPASPLGSPLVTEPVTSSLAVSGLSSEEAKKRLAATGANVVAEERVHPVRKVARRFLEPVPLMLEAAIALQLAIGERIEATIIAALLVFNVALGVFQEGRANAALAALKTRLALRASAKRDGRWIDLSAEGLVPGDIVRLSLGGIVPADVRLLDGTVLIDQSMLTDVVPLVLTGILASIPVALPATFTLAAALGAQRLGHRGVLLTRLSAIHEAATVDVLCADKTGTLTRNELMVAAVRPTKSGVDEAEMLALAALASSEGGQDPVDAAIRAAAAARADSAQLRA